MSIELKIKSKHLSEEARIIRFEEHKIKKQARWAREKQETANASKIMDTWHSLNHHRRYDVRNENRATFLARAYLDGKAYSSVEQKRSDDQEYVFFQKVLPRVLTMVKKYGKVDTTMEEIKIWLET